MAVRGISGKRTFSGHKKTNRSTAENLADPASWIDSDDCGCQPHFSTPRRAATIRDLAAWLTRHPRSTTRQILAAKRLAEMEGGAVGDKPVADSLPLATADPEDAIASGFWAAFESTIDRALAGELGTAKALKKVKRILSAYYEAVAEDGPPCECEDFSESRPRSARLGKPAKRFTGNFKDSLGRQRCYRNGKEVPCGQRSSQSTSDSTSGANKPDKVLHPSMSTSVRLRPINGRMPTNSEYAGKRYFNAFPAKLKKKYPDGVKFNRRGFPVFSPYARKAVKITYTGYRWKDFDEANKAAKYRRTPEGFTWHHHENVGSNGVGRMELVPSDLHDEVKHSGGVARWQELFPGQGSYKRHG